MEQSASDDAEKPMQESGTPEYKKLEGRIKGQVCLCVYSTHHHFLHFK